jgi:hypothetical protein
MPESVTYYVTLSVWGALALAHGHCALGTDDGAGEAARDHPVVSRGGSIGVGDGGGGGLAGGKGDQEEGQQRRSKSPEEQGRGGPDRNR